LSDGDRLLQVEEIVDKGAVARRFGGHAVAVGDGDNDMEMFRASRFSVAYGGVHPPAASLLTVATHVIYESTTLCRFLQRLC
jgi:hydroxymethylpyrimidine pyrophosphatase-like HAD family hydrolase